MKVLYGLTVIEEYDDPDVCPEPFGSHACDHVPEVGERLVLKWLDGRDAYPVRVTKVDLDQFKVWVTRIER